MSYGTGSGGIGKVENHLIGYADQNVRPVDNGVASWNELKLQNVSITETLMPHHYDGKILKRQACEYISENTKANALKDLSSLVSDANSLDSKDEMASWQDVMSTIANLLASLTEEKRQEALAVDPEADVSDIGVSIDNPASEIFNNASQKINELCDGGSGGRVTLSDYYSHRTAGQGSTHSGRYDTSVINMIASEILFRTYLFEKMGYYENLKEGSRLNYQIEYVLIGKNSDEENLKSVKRRIFAWRLADNVRLYFSDSGKKSQANAIATLACALIMQPQLIEAVTYSLLFAWAFDETVDDVKTIFDGGKIPLIKKSVGSTENGLYYYQYLDLMLLMMGETRKLARVMDIIEMDIRLTPNNQNFRIDWCLESFRATLDFHDRYGNYSIDRRYGYY
jgi:hypothetical protein